jgi:hypothetical protein
MRFRKLRIAWSIVCGIACLLLIALSVRSYWHYHMIGNQQGVVVAAVVESWRGRIWFFWPEHALSTKWRYVSQQPEVHFGTPNPPHFARWEDTFGFAVHQTPKPRPRGDTFGVCLPHWFQASVFAAMSAAIWLPWRFSLRTLLIATTMVAVVLGLIIHVSRQ